MKLTYYLFPDNTPEEILLENGCAVVLKNGEEIFPSSIPDSKRDLVDHIDHEIHCNVSTAKSLIKKYGGSGYIQHIERDGSVFEVTPIEIKGNNSRFRYNHHL